MAKTKLTAEKIIPRIDTTKLKSLGILGYDFDNKYPQRTIDIVNDSGTAVTALRTYTKFVAGLGMKDPKLGEHVINREGLTVNKLLAKIAKSQGQHNGYAVHLNYNGIGKKTEASFVPFEYNRLTDPEGKKKGKICIYDDWGGVKRARLEKKTLSYIYKYAPDDVLQQVMSIELKGDYKTDLEELAAKWKLYKGQLYYWTPEGSSEYVLAPFDSVLEDMQTEAQTKRFKNSTASKNFLASHLLITGESESDEDEDEFIENMTAFQGGENAGTLFWMQRKNPDEEIKLEKIDIQNYDGLYEYTEDSVRNAIIRNFLIPPVLLLQTEGKLGTSTEIADASIYYNGVTEPDRHTIEESLKELFSGFVGMEGFTDFSIDALQFDKPIPKDYVEFFDEDEVRKSLGYGPRKEKPVNPHVQ